MQNLYFAFPIRFGVLLSSEYNTTLASRNDGVGHRGAFMGTDNFSCKAEAFEAFDDVPLAPPRDDTIGAVVVRRYSRRDALKGSLGVAAATSLFGAAALTGSPSRAKANSARLQFQRGSQRRR